MSITRKYIIWSPQFQANIGGITVLHKLCHLLNKNGNQAYLWPSDDNFNIYLTNGKYISPLANPDDVTESIIIYPEIVSGNPLGGKNVVRWLLNKPGVVGGNGIYSENDLIFYYSNAFAENFFNRDYLQIIELYEGLYKDYQLERSGSCFVKRKGKNREIVHDLSDSIEIHDSTPSRKLADLFNCKKYFFSYDDATFLSLQAAMCGCISIVIPKLGVSPSEWKALSPLRKYGIAYGMDDIEHAISTRHLVKQHLESFEEVSQVMLELFIDKTQKHFSSTRNLDHGYEYFSMDQVIKKVKIEFLYNNLFQAELLVQKVLSANYNNPELLKNLDLLEDKRKQLKEEMNWNLSKKINEIKRIDNLIENDQMQDALNIIFTLLNLEPDNIDCLIKAAIVYLLNDVRTEATYFISRTLELDSGNHIAAELKTFLQSENRNPEIEPELIKNLRKIILDNTFIKKQKEVVDLSQNSIYNLKALIELSEIHIKHQNYFDAYLLLQKVMNENSSHELVLSTIKKLNDCIDSRRKEKRWDSKKSADMLMKAENLIEMKNLKDAKTKLYEIVTYEPQHLEALNDLAVVSILENNIVYAEELISTILRIDPVNEVALGNRNYITNLA